ncbi:uncharacterized protein [Drosophila virilis]|uniref:Uncharacterized protein, isoform B n=1 Tax=Drosophila virilis TaxID=7244 RepID=A0A0Q9WYU4_DROVI|nr:uncharacterized protein LOC6635629 isoform X2 [Drosophila virilis]KRF85632.1 uncharacterized protein Dvir_GJ16141, isoform B [Drosophila virilis]
MKHDIQTFCLLVLTILASTRHVLGFLTATGHATASGNGAAAAGEHQHSRAYLAGLGAGAVGGAEDDEQRQPNLNAQQRNVYDPGDELLHALNAELGQEPETEPETETELETEPEPERDFANAVYNELEVASKYDMLKKLEQDLRAEQELVDKSALLMKMLEDPSLDTLPLVYVEEEQLPTAIAGDDYPELDNSIGSLVLGPNKPKRSRYYRRYPWKRHNRNRGNYEPELRYACTPSKEDIFKLLVNLHENRKGNHSKTVNFCNRKRPAKVVFTNIRFLG